AVRLAGGITHYTLPLARCAAGDTPAPRRRLRIDCKKALTAPFCSLRFAAVFVAHHDTLIVAAKTGVRRRTVDERRWAKTEKKTIR
ncbi:MAG: hypothetical protein VB078_08260, partial [Clostridiaceae bacterium]|nr:hypothetical protein [Clostridiaceae bacterium]